MTALRAYYLDSLLSGDVYLDCYANTPSDLIITGVYETESSAENAFQSCNGIIQRIAEAVCIAAKADRKFIQSVWTSQEEERAEERAHRKYEMAPRVSRLLEMVVR